MPLGLSVKSGGKTYFADSLNFDNYNSFDISIPKKLLPTGVNQITLFDITGRILAERLVFINNNDFINIEVSQSKESYQPYEEINIEFNVSDNNKIPVQTTLSVAVKDVSKEIFTNYKENILSRLLLSSDIKGYIENIDYYFEKDDAIHRKALDLLLMTQGWKRYNFEIMSSQDSVNFKHYWENGLDRKSVV